MFNWLTPKIIGKVWVDSWLIWIWDPCYVLHKEWDELPDTVGQDWWEFCDILWSDAHKSFCFDGGNEWFGVCTSTYNGDGIYPVIWFFEEWNERPSWVFIDFNGCFDCLFNLDPSYV